MTEHAYSKGLTAPAEVENATNEQLSQLAARDFPEVQIAPGQWDKWSDRDKNAYGTMVTLREGEPASRWTTVKTETPSTRDVNGIIYYVITESYAEGPIEDSREMARADVRVWLQAWDTSEFTHLGTVYDINPDQERRLAVSQGQARAVGDVYTTTWYSKAGNPVQFPNRATFEAFYDSLHKHFENGNATFESTMQQIAGATDTALLDSILNNLPTIPGISDTRATGPLPGAQADPGATEPTVVADGDIFGRRRERR